MTNNAYYTFEDSFSVAVNQVFSGIVQFIPVLLGALLVLLVGLLLSGWAKSLTVKLLKVTKLDSLFTNPAIKEFLKNAQITEKIEVVIGEVVRWAIITLFFMASVNILGLTTVTAFLSTILSYIPNLFAAVIILLIGVILAGVLEKVVKGSLGSVDVSVSRFMGKFVSYTVMIVSVLAAISQLGIAQSFIEVIFTGFVATISLALGLGFGLGSKDLIKKVLEESYENFKSK